MEGAPIGELPALESMLSLRTLPAKYHDFINHKKLQADELKDVPKIMHRQWHGVHLLTATATKPTPSE
jgi:hypothetical protein